MSLVIVRHSIHHSCICNLFIFLRTRTHTAQDETTLSPADSDSWLNVDPAQLDMYLNQQYGNTKDRRLDQESLSLREKVQSFLNQTSDVDGVHFLGYDFYLFYTHKRIRVSKNSFQKQMSIPNIICTSVESDHNAIIYF